MFRIDLACCVLNQYLIRNNFRMKAQTIWDEKTDQILNYLYNSLKIFDWSKISQELAERLGLQVTSSQCRERYTEKYGTYKRNQWVPEEEKELYRLHNENGNRWAIIAQNLLGRNDNQIKNHFYSKMRKSLRTINKISKLYLKKETKQVSDLVIYKLTEVTDQSLKENTDIPEHIIQSSFQLKNKLLQYEIDQKHIERGLDYTYEKQLLCGLNEFNKLYKKKPKKQKISQLGTENLKKKRQSLKNQNVIHKDQGSYEVYLKNEVNMQKQEPYIRIRRKPQRVSRNSQNQLIDSNYDILNNPQQQIQQPKSQSQYSIAKRKINFLIKEPSQEQRDNYERKSQILSTSSRFKLDLEGQKPTFPSPILQNSLVIQTKPNKNVEDILKAEGILQNEQYANNGENYFRRSRSVRSFSMCSDSSNPDMFGQEFVFTANLKQLSQFDSQSQIFGRNNQ